MAAHDATARLIARFVEKPDLETAQAYLDEGSYLWNSGIFMMQASVWLAAIGQCRPDILAACTAAWADVARDGDFARVGKQAFAACPSDSIDYAVMERITARAATRHRRVTPALPLGVVIPLQAGWSDVGAWDALVEGAAQGRARQRGAGRRDAARQPRHAGAVRRPPDRLCRRARPGRGGNARRDSGRAQGPHAGCQEDRRHAQARGRTEGQIHRKVFRPWGWYDSVDAGARFQVKRIVVKPGGTLSLQMHHHRAEHWIVVSGTAKVTRGEESFLVSENESTYIPLGTTHRLENPGRVQLEMIEVQSGTYLGEDDIVRLEDVYGR